MSTPEVLGRTRSLVEPALRAVVEGLSARLRPSSTYHFGWTEADGSPSAMGAGKGLRPTLAVLSAEAVGASAEVAVPGAVAAELVHNFSLVHDDIIDGDTERRHRATVWSAFGTDEAIISGDALHNLAYQVLLDDPSPQRHAAAARLTRATAAMIAGQAADMAFDDLPTVTLAECVAMEADKTGALLAYSASVGAVLAGATDAQVDALDEFGMELGCAFQAVDDVLGIWGDPSVTGKAVGNDLRERKKSLPVAVVLDQGGEAADELLAIYGRDGDLTDDDVARATSVLEAAGGRSHAESSAGAHLVLALTALDGLGFDDGAVVDLNDLARFVADREF